ncbi:hypothetical protein [Falsiroseomonas sp.]|uniref:hypothetical protein n=1 Tax=Falsiroseomonas sp. TaxID=2870721 RepID=UPI0034A2BEF4
MSLKSLVAASLSAALLVGCTQRPENITARFASTTGYRAMTCDQLNEERLRVGTELQRNIDMQRTNADTDTAMVVGALFLWPMLIGLAATTDRRDQIAAMMGERDAMDLAAREKGCAPVAIPIEAPAAAPPTT